jgi:hypothetical protein
VRRVWGNPFAPLFLYVTSSSKVNTFRFHLQRFLLYAESVISLTGFAPREIPERQIIDTTSSAGAWSSPVTFSMKESARRASQTASR